MSFRITKLMTICRVGKFIEVPSRHPHNGCHKILPLHNYGRK